MGAIRLDDMKFIFYQQPDGWPGPKTTNGHADARQPPSGPVRAHADDLGETSATGACGYGNDFFGREFWRFVAVQQAVLDLAKTAVEYPPMQDPASFNLSAVKAQVEAMIKGSHGQVTTTEKGGGWCTSAAPPRLRLVGCVLLDSINQAHPA